jgi:site-specific recombinase XerD
LAEIQAKKHQTPPFNIVVTRFEDSLNFRQRERAPLRHSAVTMLKAAGVSDFIAREIVGHESAAVSRQYTHLTTDDKRAAMQRLPDVLERNER